MYGGHVHILFLIRALVLELFDVKLTVRENSVVRAKTKQFAAQKLWNFMGKDL